MAQHQWFLAKGIIILTTTMTIMTKAQIGKTVFGMKNNFFYLSTNRRRRNENTLFIYCCSVFNDY